MTQRARDPAGKRRRWTLNPDCVPRVFISLGYHTASGSMLEHRLLKKRGPVLPLIPYSTQHNDWHRMCSLHTYICLRNEEPKQTRKHFFVQGNQMSISVESPWRINKPLEIIMSDTLLHFTVFYNLHIPTDPWNNLIT